MLPLICYEAIFPQDVLAARPRAGWMLQITNDAWFGSYQGPFQHFAQARLRASSPACRCCGQRIPASRAVIDAHGRVLDRLALDTRGHLDVALPGALPQTLYARTGDGPAALLLVLGLLALLVPSFRRRPWQRH